MYIRVVRTYVGAVAQVARQRRHGRMPRSSVAHYSRRIIISVSDLALCTAHDKSYRVIGNVYGYTGKGKKTLSHT